MNQKRIARICWNTNDWKKPSGEDGKSLYEDSFEYQNGFGYEEWLFDDKVIDGYKYGWLEPINKANRNKYLNSVFDIALYTIERGEKGENKSERSWVGEIKNVEVIDTTEEARINTIYKNNKWDDLMQQDLNSFGHSLGNITFNIKFKLEDVHLFDKLIKIEPTNHRIYKIHRYTFLENIPYPFPFPLP